MSLLTTAALVLYEYLGAASLTALLAHPQDPPPPNCIRVHVASATSQTAVPGAFVLFEPTAASPEHSAVGDANGWAWLPGVTFGQEPTLQTIRIEHVDYLPYRGRITIADRQRATFRSIVPADIGYKTTIVSAARGGRFELAGLGTVRVAPGALLHDCSLRLIPIPEVSRSDLLTGVGHLRYQVWLTAFDDLGNSAHTALPTAPGAITLEIAVPEGYVAPDNAMLETWTTHCLGRFDQAATSVGQCSGKTVIMPVGAGHNLLMHDYRTPTADPNCQQIPWEMRVVLIGQRVVADGPSVPVICGVITQGCSYKIKESTVFSTTFEFEETNLRKYGVESKVPLVDKVSVEVGFTSKFKQQTNTVETLGKEQHLGTDAGTTLSRQPMGQQPPGYDCISATLRHGCLFRKYRVEALRQVAGGGRPETHPLAVFEVFGGGTQWLEGVNGLPLPQWNTNCGFGCNPAGAIPADIPLKPQ
jgi:hypothetical protein